jgi:hypothetical protein
MESKEYVVFRHVGMIYRVPKHSAETHEQAFQKAILLSKMESISLSSQVKWSIVCAQQLKKNYGLEYTTELETLLQNKF